MDEVGESPDHGHAGEGNAEQDDVQEADAQDVRQPHPPAVHHSGVGVHLAVRRAHIHDGASKPSTYKIKEVDVQDFEPGWRNDHSALRGTERGAHSDRLVSYQHRKSKFMQLYLYN